MCNLVKFGDGPNEVSVMYDAKIHGAWGNVCGDCFRSDGLARLGLGFGQQYKLEVRDGKKAWFKIAG
jgi:hypothetical protein